MEAHKSTTRKTILKTATQKRFGLGKRTAIAAAISLSAATFCAPVLADDVRDNRRSSFDLGRIVLNLGDRDYRSDRSVYERRQDSRYDSRYNSRYSNRHNDSYRGGRHVDTRHHRSGPITVRINYDANGDGQLRLKRLLRDQHGINPNDWRIRSVNVRHKSRREACADLTVGGRSTGPVYLRKGITTLQAPRGNANGGWVLGFENAKLRDVAVVLDPVRDNRANRPSNRRSSLTSRNR